MTHPIPLASLRLFALLTAITLGGCALVPGSNIGVSTSGDADAIDSHVNIYPITTTFISRLQAANTEQLRAAPVSTALQQEIEAYDYYVGIGDTLYITIYDHPELTAPAGNQNQSELFGNIVRSDGSIFYPYIGNVQARDRTVEEIRAEIAERITQFITRPQVDVRVLRYNSQRAYITGQVAQPGPQPITNVPLTVLDAISQAGGLNENASWHNAQLVRENGEEIPISLHQLLNNGRLDQNRLLRHGDVLNVQNIGNNKIFVMGELNRVSSIPMGGQPISLTDALSQSGGISQLSANASGIFVIRPTAPGGDRMADVFQLDAENALAFALGARFMLQPQDIVYVTTAPISRWNRVLSQLLPSLSSLLLLDNLGTNLAN